MAKREWIYRTGHGIEVYRTKSGAYTVQSPKFRTLFFIVPWTVAERWGDEFAAGLAKIAAKKVDELQTRARELNL